VRFEPPRLRGFHVGRERRLLHDRAAFVVFGGEVLRSFGFTMVVGIIVGTYSTIFIATPLVVWWGARSTKRRRHVPPL
jgi:preprotein translocase subunit SecF